MNKVPMTVAGEQALRAELEQLKKIVFGDIQQPIIYLI